MWVRLHFTVGGELVFLHAVALHALLGPACISSLLAARPSCWTPDGRGTQHCTAHQACHQPQRRTALLHHPYPQLGRLYIYIHTTFHVVRRRGGSVVPCRLLQHLRTPCAHPTPPRPHPIHPFTRRPSPSPHCSPPSHPCSHSVGFFFYIGRPLLHTDL